MNTIVQPKQKQPSNRLLGKTALVTGGARGIGAAIALRLAEEGATVAINYVNSKDAAEAVIHKISETGGNAIAFKANVADEKEVKKLVTDFRQLAGRIDILINNAGVYESAPLEELSLEHYERVFDVNIKGVVATTAAAVGAIPAGGRIINLSSVAAHYTMAGSSIYSASKAALDALTRIWATELGPKGITVNGIAPGPTQTDMYHAAIPEQVRHSLITKTPLGRIGEVDDIAAVAAFLASDESKWITGQTITVDGGFAS